MKFLRPIFGLISQFQCLISQFQCLSSQFQCLISQFQYLISQFQCLSDQPEHVLIDLNQNAPSLNTYNAADVSRRHVQNLTQFVNKINILECDACIWNHHGKCFQTNTNMSGIG